jgi:hypothetical protein
MFGKQIKTRKFKEKKHVYKDKKWQVRGCRKKKKCSVQFTAVQNT